MGPVPTAVEAVVGSASAAGTAAVEERVGAVQKIEAVAEMVADKTIPAILAMHKAKKTRPVVQVVEGHS